METFDAEMRIELLNESFCTVKEKKESSIQQGYTIYLVDYNKEGYILKWYDKPRHHNFYEKLQFLIDKCAPSSSFLWPEALTKELNGSFGYLIKEIPQGYIGIGDYLISKSKFESVDALLDACIHICSVYMQNDLWGKHFYNVEHDTFLINPATGDVIVNWHYSLYRLNREQENYLCHYHYRAPELIENSDMRENVYTDAFSLATVLFHIIFLNYPFEGAKYLSNTIITEKYNKTLYNKDAIFMMDPSDSSNGPVKGFNNSVLRRWHLFPKILREAFIATFSKEAMHDPSKRIVPSQWIRTIIQVKSMFATCPHCSNKTFIIPGEFCTCTKCEKYIPKIPVLKMNLDLGYSIPLVPGQYIYMCQTSLSYDCTTSYGKVIRSPKNPNLWGIRNLSGKQWIVNLPNGTEKLIDPNNVMPVQTGLIIRFPSAYKGEIII